MKKRKIGKILSLALSALLLFSTVAGAGCGEDEVALPSQLDYSNSTKQFNFYAYSSMSDGSYIYNNQTYDTGERYLNEYRLHEYFDTGMKMHMPQVTALAPSAEKWETSDLKKLMDMAHELGYDNSVIITDNWLYSPYTNSRSNIKSDDPEDYTVFGNQSWQYADEAALDAYVEARIRMYGSHPAFAGVMLNDEPQAKGMKVVGQMYASVRRVEKKLRAEGFFDEGLEELYINANLLPYFPNLVASAYPVVEEDFHPDKEQRDHEAFRRYLDLFMKHAGPDKKYLQMDIYPLNNDSNVYRTYIINLQIAGEVARRYDSKLVVVSQTMTMNTTRILEYRDLNYLNNILMGFGCDNIGYFTYYTHDDSESELFDDNGSMLTRFGERTHMYYDMQKITRKGQVVAPVIRNFDYQTSQLYMSQDAAISAPDQHMTMAQDYAGKTDFPSFKKLKSVHLDKEMAIVTELYDDEKDNYMYMAFNSVDPMYTGSKTYETITMTFASGYTHAWVYYDGEFSIQKLKDSKISVKLKPGEAKYLIPFKA